MSTEEQRLAPLREKIDALDAQIKGGLNEYGRTASRTLTRKN